MSTLPNGTLAYRMGQAEAEIGKLWATNPALTADRLEALSDDVKSLRRGFYAFAFTIAGSAVVFALSVFAMLAAN